MPKKKTKGRTTTRRSPVGKSPSCVKSTLSCSRSTEVFDEDRGFDPNVDRLDSQLEELSRARSIISSDMHEGSSGQVVSRYDSGEASAQVNSTPPTTDKSGKPTIPTGKKTPKSPTKPASGHHSKSNKSKKKTGNGLKVVRKSKSKSKSMHGHKKSNPALGPPKKVKSRGMVKSPAMVTPSGNKTQFKSAMAMATASKLPAPRPNMRPMPSERIKELSTGNFLIKYRSAVKALNAKRPQPVLSSMCTPQSAQPSPPPPVKENPPEMLIDPDKMKLMQELWNCFEALMQKTKTPSTIGSTLQTKTGAMGTYATPGTVGQLSPADRPTKEEMEELNDQLSDLNTSINTLRFSYGSIIRSLVKMQARRKRAKMNLGPVKCDDAGNPEAGTEGVSIEIIAARARTVNYAEKYAIERFVESDTRDLAFQQLFKEVNEVNQALLRFKTLFDAEGYFQEQAYLESDFRISKQQYTEVYKVVSEMEQAVAGVLRAYNTEMLDMFRLK